MQLSNNYNFLIELGTGSFGSVWRVQDKKTKEELAMKIEDKSNKARLKSEFHIYKKLEQNNINYGIPKIKCYFESNKKCFMIMELLGKSLDQILNDMPYGFDIPTVLHFGIVITSLLEIVHNTGYLHRDIKPNNFLFGHKSNNLYIMDFGLSKKYINKNNQHIALKTGRTLVGTARYVSINIHNGLEPSRRDELESVGYMLIYFLLKKLPWQGLKKQPNITQMNLIGECKKKISLDELCYGLPKCIKEYIKYCRDLKFEERPDYNYLKELLRNA